MFIDFIIKRFLFWWIDIVSQNLARWRNTRIAIYTHTNTRTATRTSSMHEWAER